MTQHPLYFIACLSPPDYPKKIVRRVLKLEEAISFVTKKTGLEVKGSDVIKNVWAFSDNTYVKGSESDKFIAQRIRAGLTKPIIKIFVINKVLNIPGASDNLVIEILEEEDPMIRDNLILNYKLKHLDRFPDVAKMIKKGG